MPRCPICRKEVGGRAKNPAFPFCSARCQLIDLGKWLGGDYRIAGRPEENEDEAPAVVTPPSRGSEAETDDDPPT